MSKVSKKQIKETEIVIDNKNINNIDLSLYPTKSSKIRYLLSLNFKRSEIANLLQIRYQHVRNVEVTLLKKDMNK